MRFEQRLENEAVPEWRAKYVDYRHLKTIIDKMPPREEEEFDTSLGAFKSISHDDEPLDELEALFFDRIALELAKVSDAYQLLEAEATDRLQQFHLKLDDHIGAAATTFFGHERPKWRSKSRQHSVKNKLKKAIREYYRSLELIANFQLLNYQAFGKILKKFDKRTLRKSSSKFMEKVKEQGFYRSDAVSLYREDIEGLYRRFFTDGKRSQALQELRTTDNQGKTYQWQACLGGAIFGLCLALLFQIVHMAFRGPDTLKKLAAFHFFLGLPLLLSALFLLDILIWEVSHVNYRFIFEFDPRSALHPAEIMLLIGILDLAQLATISLSLNGYFNAHIVYSHQSWLIIGLVISMVLLPLPVLYHKSRLWLARHVVRILLAPFHRVSFADFFLADQLMSLMMTFQTVGWLIHMASINPNDISEPRQLSIMAKVFMTVLLPFPPTLRASQCLRRFFDDGKRSFFPHLTNFCKYLFPLASSVITIWAGHIRWAMLLSVILRIIGSIDAIIWDITMDFGLLQRGTINWLLRENLAFRHHSLYYFIMLFDTFGRLFWLLPFIKALHWKLSTLSQLAVVALVEVIRRACWNLIRIEFEHVNNCSTLRAFKDIPLPPNVKDLFYNRPVVKDEHNIANDEK